MSVSLTHTRRATIAADTVVIGSVITDQASAAGTQRVWTVASVRHVGATGIVLAGRTSTGRAVRTIWDGDAGVSIRQAAEPMRRQPEQQQQDRDIPARPATLTRDQAAAKLAVTPDWVRRLVKAGKLTTVGADVTAASVDAYAQTRHATRFAKTPDTETARAIAAAKRAQTQAAALERKARKLRETAKATLTSYGPGAHAGWLISQGPSVDVAAHTRSGSWTAQPIAA